MSPDTPSNFSHSNVTTSSVILSWIVGDDGGDTQAFHIEYKLVTSGDWQTVPVPIDKADNISEVEFTLDKLRSGEEYQIRVYARNNFGESGRLILIIDTLAERRKS